MTEDFPYGENLLIQNFCFTKIYHHFALRTPNFALNIFISYFLKCFGKIFREWCSKAYFFTAFRVNKSNLSCVEKLTRKRKLLFFKTVGLVAQYGMENVLRMDTNLVCPPRLKLALDICVFSETL